MTMERVLTEQETRVWVVYEALWRKLAQEGVRIQYDGCLPNGQAGYFTLMRGRPTIAIQRKYYQPPSNEPMTFRNDGAVTANDSEGENQPDLLEELITTAHEAGHCHSWRLGNRTPEYVEAADAMQVLLTPGHSITDRQRMVYMADEHRAWKYGRVVLKKLGFREWKAFNASRRNGLHQYDLIFSGAIHRKETATTFAAAPDEETGPLSLDPG